MSIASASFAEFGECKREEWLPKLEAARAAKDWDAVENLIEEMRNFYFAE
jgi:hypothetical protein